MQYLFAFIIGLFSKRTAIVILSILLVITGYFLYSYFIKSDPSQGAIVRQSNEEFGLTDESTGAPVSLSGTISMTGYNKEDNNPLHTYSLNLGSTTATVVDESARYGLFTSSFLEVDDVDDVNLAFIKSYVASTTDEAVLTAEIATVVVYKNAEENLVSSAIVIDEASAMGTMAFSKVNKLLALTRLRESNLEGGALIGDWDVLVTNLNGEVVHTISGAASPAWSADGKHVVYIKNDGIYSFDIGKGEESKGVHIASFNPEGQLDPSGNYIFLALSADDKTIVMTLGSRVETYQIDSWDNFSLTPISRMINEEASYSWPVISPDGQYYAVLNKSSSSAVLEVRKLNGKVPVWQKTIDGLDVGSLCLDLWLGSSSIFQQ